MDTAGKINKVNEEIIERVRRRFAKSLLRAIRSAANKTILLDLSLNTIK